MRPARPTRKAPLISLAWRVFSASEKIDALAVTWISFAEIGKAHFFLIHQINSSPEYMINVGRFYKLTTSPSKFDTLVCYVVDKLLFR